MASVSPTTLSHNDSLVLSSVFEPESSGLLSHSNSLVDPALPPSLPHIDSKLLPELQARERAALQPLNSFAPAPSLITAALAQLEELIAAQPSYASAYNNRAQALRLLVGDDLFSRTVQQTSLWNDLCEAIRLAAPESEGLRVCNLQAGVLAAAYIQRGHLLLKAARKCSDLSVKEGDEEAKWLPKELSGLDKASIEEIASKDFEMAGKYGDQEAQKLAAVTNPYARLCGGIVKEAMKAELASFH